MRMSNSREVKICVYWKRQDANTWATYWVGGRGKDNMGVRDRPRFMIKLFLEFAFRNNWVSPGDILAYLIVRDRQVIEMQLKKWKLFDGMEPGKI